MSRLNLLIVEDDSDLRRTLQMLLKEHFNILLAKDGVESIRIVKSKPVDIVLMDIRLPRLDGIKALEKIKEHDKDIGVIMLSALDSAQQAVSALKKGAYDYVTKPFDEEELISTLVRCAETLVLKNEVAYLKQELSNHSKSYEIISRSACMKKIFELIGKVSRTPSGVLITGETGTGKELVARAIHSLGDRKDKRFVTVNCGAVPSELMESEFFGHERGAFTGAVLKKIGKFEYADGGTIFLDEVAMLPMHLQVKLLRVLQEKGFERVGSNVPINVDIRVIAATNVDLEEAIRKGDFREDLYYRLKVVPIELPPLRERKEDIPLLSRHFLKKHSANCNRKVSGVSKEALSVLCKYAWPGNIRELENLMERLVVLAKDDGKITCKDLPAEFFNELPDPNCEPPKESTILRESCRSFERLYIIGILNKTNWNRQKAAQEMDIHRNTLLHKMKSLGIERLVTP